MPLTVKCSVRRMSQAELILPTNTRTSGWVAEGQNIHQITEKGGYF